MAVVVSADRAAELDHNRLGVILFVASEVVFFGTLLLAYVYYHGRAGDTIAAARHLDPLKTGAYSIALFSSSATALMVERSLRKLRHGPACAWMAATIALGATFVVGEALEYRDLMTHGITFESGLFGTTFFTLTGFHGLHVLGGITMWSILLGLTLAGRLRGPRVSAITAGSIYWHFVDTVWVAIFSTVYLWTPR